ncbi:protein of unknown function [Paraburkholderia dioscoreae]|uniref:Uncharacterized protein n=1 Tax=Paraburkholderia dioscoreae TaxID=2604047 RepID=A0A5Q4Z729_9BURK|nr:protein of unknown function [Paraburkholderia dioscoreae]
MLYALHPAVCSLGAARMKHIADFFRPTHRSLWNHCASTTRSRVTSKLSCRCKTVSCGCTSAG